MKRLIAVALFALIYASFAPNTVLAFDSFGFYCQPYIKTFEEGKHYIPANENAPTYISCSFEIPTSFDPSSQNINVAIYKGSVGNAQLITNRNVSPFYNTASPLLVLGVDFIGHSPTQDDNFFAVVYEKNSWDEDAGMPTIGAAANDYKIINWKWGAKPVSEWDPVIIIPGILGSWEKNGTWILDPLAHTYDNLIDTLKANGYVENQTLFTLPYDWEQSNVVTAELLKQKIEQIKTTCSCSKVDIVAHSMGGLVATQYIMSDTYGNDIDQLFMLGTPIAGAPKAYKAWEAGIIDFAEIQTNIFLSRVFEREAVDNGYSSIFDYIRNKPVTSIQEILPVYQNYLKLGSTVLQYPTGYPQNPFLENLIGNPVAYNSKVLGKVQTYVVTGNLGSASTATSFVVKQSTQLPKWEHGEVVSTINGIGDGTVPLDNATYFSGPDKEFQNISHVRLASSSSVYVFTQLTGGAPATVIGKNYTALNADLAIVADKAFPSSNEFNALLQTVKDTFEDATLHTLLLIMLFSPVDVQVTAPDGKKLGKDFATNTNLTEIPNSTYSGPIGEHEYVLIVDPLPGEYKVSTVGTGIGTYTIAAGRINSSTTTLSLVSGTTTLNQVISNTLFYSSTSTSVTLTPPLPPIATSTPTTTPTTPDICISDITKAYKDKWISKKVVYEKLVFDCKALKELIKARENAKTKLALGIINTAIKLVLADMDLLAKDKANTKDAVLLITKITTWFKNDLHL